MKKYKKFWAVLLTLVMVLGMSMTTMAAAPSDKNTGSITVKNVESGATVTVYQFIKAVYNADNNAFTGYQWKLDQNATATTEAVTFDADGKVDGLTDEYVTNLAKNVTAQNASKSGNVAENAIEVTISGLPVGSYLVLVTPPATNAAKNYNPMVASIYYSESGSSDSKLDGTVDANDEWKIKDATVYTKSSDITLTKKVADDTKGVGEVADFTIGTSIPSYSEQYGDVKVTLTDSIKNQSLEYVKNAVGDKVEPTVTVGGVTLEKEKNGVKQYELTWGEDEQSFTIEFQSAYVKGLAGLDASARKVVVTYQATVTEKTLVTAPAQNEVSLTYKETPDNEKTITRTENVYTFDIDGAFKKVEKNAQGKEVARDGATFTLYSDVALTTPVGNSTSDANGNIKFAGLSAFMGNDTEVGEQNVIKYYLKETAAPTGYTINDTVYTVWVSNVTREANSDNVTGYELTIQYTEGGKIKTVTANANATGKVATPVVNIVNTKLGTLPSTGGIGTTIFTIGGCAIMIAAAFLFFASRKKNDNK